MVQMIGLSVNFGNYNGTPKVKSFSKHENKSISAALCAFNVHL
jgi:hypothetical protein